MFSGSGGIAGAMPPLYPDLDYEELRLSLPKGVVPAYDGMRLTLERAVP